MNTLQTQLEDQINENTTQIGISHFQTFDGISIEQITTRDWTVSQSWNTSQICHPIENIAFILAKLRFKNLQSELDEKLQLTFVTCDVMPFVQFQAMTKDQILFTRIDQSLFIEDHKLELDYEEVILTDPDAASQRDAIISAIRQDRKSPVKS
jgi:hypothetical protein